MSGSGQFLIYAALCMRVIYSTQMMDLYGTVTYTWADWQALCHSQSILANTALLCQL